MAGLGPSGGGLAARAEALRLLDLILNQHQKLDECFGAAAATGVLAGASQADRNLCYAIVATTLRRHGEITAAIDRHLTKKLPRSSGPARLILMTAACQLLFMRVAAHAAVDTAVRLARFDVKARHFAGLINAVCRRIAADAGEHPPEPSDPFINTPLWLSLRWRQTYGEAEAAAIALSHIEEPPIDLSVRTDPQAWAGKLGGRVFHDHTVRLDGNGQQVSHLAGYGDGHWWVQDAASALPARLLGDVRARTVLDLCAAPGGKTAQLAAIGAEVTAVDRSASRLGRLQENLARLQLTARVVQADILEYAPEQLFDAVLLDAPCSGTGTIRRNPDLPFHRDAPAIAELSLLQRRLLDRAASFIRPGGRLVFSTCSLEPEESEEHLLDLPDHMTLLPIDSAIDGLKTEWVDARGCLRTRPSQGLDGFFAMRLARR
jgi:16S rRNA (cytosine967-C5)-methyltransferase